MCYFPKGKNHRKLPIIRDFSTEPSHPHEHLKKSSGHDRLGFRVRLSSSPTLSHRQSILKHSQKDMKKYDSKTRLFQDIAFTG